MKVTRVGSSPTPATILWSQRYWCATATAVLIGLIPIRCNNFYYV